MPNLRKEFCKIYKEHTKPIIKHYLDREPNYKPIAYTIYAGKNRFRSGLSYILSGKKEQGKAIGVVAEIMWATCLIYDDIGDRDILRRGKLSAWKKFGLLWAVHSAALGLDVSKNLLRDYGLDNKIIKSLEKNFLLTLKSQIEQDCFFLSTSPKKILKNYFNKGALGKWSIEAGVKLNKRISKKEQELINLFAVDLSIVAQIKNDLQDIVVGPETALCMRDIGEGIVTYPIAIFYQRANKHDKKIFKEQIWAKKNLPIEKTQKRVMPLFKKYNVLDYCHNTLQRMVIKSSNTIKTIKDTEIKNILLHWAETYKSI